MGRGAAEPFTTNAIRDPLADSTLPNPTFQSNWTCRTIYETRSSKETFPFLALSCRCVYRRSSINTSTRINIKAIFCCLFARPHNWQVGMRKFQDAFYDFLFIMFLLKSLSWNTLVNTWPSYLSTNTTQHPTFSIFNNLIPCHKLAPNVKEPFCRSAECSVWKP